MEYEEKEPILTIDDAIAKESYMFPPYALTHCNSDAIQSAKATTKFKGSFRVGGQEHFYMETCGALAEPSGEERSELVCHVTTQAAAYIQHNIAHSLGLRQSEVRVTSRRNGGAFGGKEKSQVRLKW